MAMQKNFIDNEVIIMNRETHDFWYKGARTKRYQDSIRYKTFMLDEEIKKLIKIKRSYNK